MATALSPRGFRPPAEVIKHAVWLRRCFSFSLRDGETISMAGGVVVSCESIQEWGLRFGRLFAATLKRHRLNNRAEVSYRPTRRRERQMRQFKSAWHAQRFLSARSRNHLQLRRRLTANRHRAVREAAFHTWREVVGGVSVA